MPTFSRSVGRARKLASVLTQADYRRGLRHGVAASVEHEAIPLRRDFRTVIDAGANRGQFALVAAHRFPSATLLCFEPLSAPRARLVRVLEGRSGTRTFDVALGAKDETADFHVAGADDSSSLLPIGSRQRHEFPETAQRTTTTVQARRLDGVLSHRDLVAPVLLKIDVQGGELGVLQGAGGLLDSVDAVLVEASFIELYDGQALVDEVWELLHGAGFASRGVWSLVYGRQGICLQGDFLFARAEFEPFA
ncbi:MAG: FkbM family methyltransferase [Solirubrobacteraceae bacterium]